MAARPFSVFCFLLFFCWGFFFPPHHDQFKRQTRLRPIGGDSCCPLVPGTQKLIYSRVCDSLFLLLFFFP